jgi:hypothetical protein
MIISFHEFVNFPQGRRKGKAKGREGGRQSGKEVWKGLFPLSLPFFFPPSSLSLSLS